MDDVEFLRETGLSENLIASSIGSSVVLAQRKVSRRIALLTAHAARTHIHYGYLNTRKEYMLKDSSPVIPIGLRQKVRIGIRWRWGSKYKKTVNDAKYHKWWGFAFLARGMDTNNPKWFMNSIEAFKVAYVQEDKLLRLSHCELYQLHPCLELARCRKDGTAIKKMLAYIEHKLEEGSQEIAKTKEELDEIHKSPLLDTDHGKVVRKDKLENELNNLYLYEAKAWRILGYIYHRVFEVFGDSRGYSEFEKKLKRHVRKLGN